MPVFPVEDNPQLTAANPRVDAAFGTAELKYLRYVGR